MNAYGADPRLMAGVPEAMRGTPMQGIPHLNTGTPMPPSAPMPYGPAPQALAPPTLAPQLTPRTMPPTSYSGNPNASPNPPPGSPGLPINMAAMTSAPVGAAAQMGQEQAPKAYPSGDKMHMPIGQNGYGLHPDVTPSDIVDYLIPKIKSVESGGDPANYIGKVKGVPYGNRTKNTASGHFGYEVGTWNNYKGYPRAMDAPPEIQEEKFRKDIGSAVIRFGGDPFKAVANHYYPAHASDPTKWDTEIPGAGTVNQYLSKVFNAGPERAGDRHAKYIQGVNSNRQSNNNQTSVQLP